MATVTIYNRFCKGISNKGTPSLCHTFWQTSFNMPVVNVFQDESVSTNTEWIIDGHGVTDSFDLTGFQEGWEMAAGVTTFLLTSFPGGNVTATQTWKDPYGTTIFSNTVNQYIASGSWALGMVSNQGVAEWEISENGTYSMVAEISGPVTGSQTFTFNVTNHPHTANETPGYVWVEGVLLRWVGANGHVHHIFGDLVSNVGSSKAGHLYVESSDNSIRWVASNGGLYKSKYHFKQFLSVFTNGPSPPTVSGATPGAIWVDTNFGYEHIAYIGHDGCKWILPSGGNPYANPPLSQTF